jgi:hypothetical protein
MYLGHSDLGKIVNIDDVFVIFEGIVFELRAHGDSSIIYQHVDFQVVGSDKI